jgi:phosphate uptake regulator
METNIFPSSKQELKSYWSRPGGKFGVFFGLALIGAIAYFVVPILTTIVWNTINFGIALVCLAIFVYVITHRKLRLSLFYFYEILMKKLVGIVIELDPFIIAEDYLGDMVEQREKLYKQSIEVDGQKEKINLKIKEKKSEISKLMSKAQVAKEQNMLPELGNATRQIGRLNEYIAQLTPIHDNLSRIGDYLTKIHKNSAYLIEDAKNELELKKDLYKSVTSGNQALSSALKIFKGDPEKKLLVEQSMEFLKEDIAVKLASMKKAISYSADFMQSIDLDNATYQKEGLKLLEDGNPDSGYKLSSTSFQNMPSTATNYNDLLQ